MSLLTPRDQRSPGKVLIDRNTLAVSLNVAADKLHTAVDQNDDEASANWASAIVNLTAALDTIDN